MVRTTGRFEDDVGSITTGTFLWSNYLRCYVGDSNLSIRFAGAMLMPCPRMPRRPAPSSSCVVS